ncbi:metal-sensing transcriptional repressor [Candidatus Dojkabacteria bacterium]|uniref:Metal-sensing transcriptional repressor n=1 Tax=Candidatus Dojkabacteria bacterium TaxID=2099670 RepID=A0A955LAF9_9BACT|nr:metal-sensing transcriptional repressor [Candidatus Dojkabacteria bacterium]
MDNCKKFNSQINRISGQVNGISKMIDSGRPVSEIVNQISAARAALSRLAVDLLKNESSACFSQEQVESQQKKFEELVTNFFKIT